MNISGCCSWGKWRQVQVGPQSVAAWGCHSLSKGAGGSLGMVLGFPPPMVILSCSEHSIKHLLQRKLHQA